jgi:CSLREA domain-containing protein
MFTKTTSFVFRCLSTLMLLNLLIVAVGILPAQAGSPVTSKAGTAGTATFTVNSNSDADHGSDGVCTLREAIRAANQNADYHECIHTGSGFGNDVIVFSISGSSTIILGAALPAISTSTLTIDGSNSGRTIVIDGANAYEPFSINSSASLTLKKTTVQHGHSSDGGGVFNVGTLNVFNSTFLNNVATADGGAINNNSGGTATIANSTFSGNSASYGGGLENNSSTATILNSTFSGNTAIEGGALSTWQGGSEPVLTRVKNTIMANSVAPEDCWNGSGTLRGDHNIIETTVSGGFSCSGITTSTANPKLGTLTGSPAYFPLNVGSPAIDTGNDSICAAPPVNNQSQNGVTRPQGVHCDIGAYEYVFVQRVKNGGFNTYVGTSKIPEYWTASNFKPTDGKDTTVHQEGTASVKIIGKSGVTKTLTQTIALSGTAGDKFSFSFQAKGNAIPTSGLCMGQVKLYNRAILVSTQTVNCATGIYGFQLKTLNFTAPKTYNKVVVVFTYYKASGTIWFDAVSLMK